MDHPKVITVQDGQSVQMSRHTRPKGFLNWIKGWYYAWFPGKLSEDNFMTLDIEKTEKTGVPFWK